ncbi:DUF6236 family protein [Streptomyces sp. AP-93]|uniref:DUF6236 family protein n=1 Tax=Streptomyces sp. AP-93 TaxID=2929048 RepID=UPI0035B1B149
MSPELAWVYECALAEELARRGGYAPTTDRTASHTASQGRTSRRSSCRRRPVATSGRRSTGGSGSRWPSWRSRCAP